MSCENEKQQKTKQDSTTEVAGETCETGDRGGEKFEATSEAQDQSLMEEILDKENLKIAYARVVKNGGAAGIDGLSTDDLQAYLAANWKQIKQELLQGTYKPRPVRRVNIPKPGGGKRQLGIPTVMDRFIQQAVMQVLQRKWDSTFSEHSYGFRPGRSAKQAIEAARKHIEGGYRVVVDIDLEKFFDRVNHDVLMNRVTKRISDKRVHKLIRAYLNAGALEGGLTSASKEGIPQGGPLSPLLSNLLLDELDRELERRNLHFVRYADDCNIYVASQRAGERVMKGITEFLGKRLRLQVNKEKSAVGKPWSRSFLGVSFYANNRGVKPRVASKSLARFKQRIRELTRPTKGKSVSQVIGGLREYLLGWRGYFVVCDTPKVFRNLDKWIRRRIRCYIWRQWKRGRTRYTELLRRGIHPQDAARASGSAKGPWRLSKNSILHHAIPSAALHALGLPKLVSAS